MSTKQFKIRQNIGRSKYCVSYHDGVKRHSDGSDFYDLAIFSNKRKLAIFLKQLRRDGYVEL